MTVDAALDRRRDRADRRRAARRSRGTGAPLGPPTNGRGHFAVLAANVLAVAHEQQRLQADIVDAMDAGLVTAGQVIDEVMPRLGAPLPSSGCGRQAAGARRSSGWSTDVWEAARRRSC